MQNKAKAVLCLLLLLFVLCALLSACGGGGGDGTAGTANAAGETGAASENSSAGTGAAEQEGAEQEGAVQNEMTSDALSTGAPTALGTGSPSEEESGVPSAAGTSKTGSAAADAAPADVLEIKEKMFLTQITDIFCNFDDYKDKTIVVEGMFDNMYINWDQTETAPAVYRNGPGCCGNDGWGGFLLLCDGPYPEVNDWVRVTGTPELITSEDGYDDLYLKVQSLEVKKERGAEFVSQ